MRATRPIHSLISRLVLPISQQLVSDFLLVLSEIRISLARVDEEWNSRITQLEQLLPVLGYIEEARVTDRDGLEPCKTGEGVIDDGPCSVAVSSEPKGVNSSLTEGGKQSVYLGLD